MKENSIQTLKITQNIRNLLFQLTYFAPAVYFPSLFAVSSVCISATPSDFSFMRSLSHLFPFRLDLFLFSLHRCDLHSDNIDLVSSVEAASAHSVMRWVMFVYFALKYIVHLQFLLFCFSLTLKGQFSVLVRFLSEL